MLNIVSALFSGLFIGVLARWFYPGAVQMGWLMTILLGIGGSLLVGLFTASRTGGIGGAYSRPGCLASVLGAMTLIFIGRVIAAG